MHHYMHPCALDSDHSISFIPRLYSRLLVQKRHGTRTCIGLIPVAQLLTMKLADSGILCAKHFNHHLTRVGSAILRIILPEREDKVQQVLNGQGCFLKGVAN